MTQSRRIMETLYNSGGALAAERGRWASAMCVAGSRTEDAAVAASRFGRRLSWLMGMASATALSSAAELPPRQLEFFESKVRPILVESCYKCHSAEAGKSKGSLILDSRDALRKGGESGAVIVPGDPDHSVLIQAIRYKDEDLQMPPPDGDGKLSAEKISVLEEWVKMGAPDPRTGGKAHPMDMAAARQHWTFQPVTKAPLPAVKQGDWIKTPVDRFVLAQLEAKNLAPSPRAEPSTLLRRVTYDLTGLPPSAEDMEAFQRDPSPDAYTKAVDRLLASPRYGERWGRFWLDIARYADTKGYLVGNAERRFAFSHTYRDYVIRAFNEDKPYDRFVIEQLAADQLPLGEDKSALAAMGFLTLGRTFLNNQNDVIDDRIDVVTRGLMGLTVTCARCHDHKFDPIPTKDYYSLHGVFASSEEPKEKPLLGPLVESPAYQEFLKKTAAAEAKVAERARTEVNKFLTSLREKTGDYLLGVHDAAKLAKEEKFDLFAGTRKLNVEVLKRYQPWLAQRAKQPDPVLAPWFAFAALPEAEFAAQARELVASWARGGAPEAKSSGGHPAEVTPDLTKAGALNPLVVAAFINAEKPLESLKDVAAIYNGLFADVEKSWETVAEAALKENSVPPASLDDPNRESLRQVMYASGAPANLGSDEASRMIKRTIEDKTAGLKREIEGLNWTEPGAPLRAMALVDKPKPRSSNVFLRGNPLNKGPEVPRRFLEVIGGESRTPFVRGSGRLELAEEIVDPKNPLTARVFVNRVWGWHFGQALVRTPSDFGVRTEAPVHRALLDWLAASLVEGGWSVKQLHRLIVLSNTYQQSSDERPAASVADPDNQLIHRFNRRRLEFEALRDTLLAVSGALDLKPGGLPDDLTKEPFTRRRTVYGFIDRQNLPGMFRTFDFPSPDVSSAGRFATTVPQQALFMMNSRFAQEQARQTALRADLHGGKTDAEKIRALYRLVYQRPPAADELALAERFIHREAEAMDPETVRNAGWRYGYGGFDPATNRVTSFEPMTVHRDDRIRPGEKFPDATLGYISLTPIGGHPGYTPQAASIRRWIAPAKGSVRIEGTLGHTSTEGDGVRGRIVSSARGKLGEWSVHNTKVTTKLDGAGVEAGESIDFVVDAVADSNSDTFNWAPVISFKGEGDTPSRTWNAKNDFAATAYPLTRWEELAQVLLLSNELAFVD